MVLEFGAFSFKLRLNDFAFQTLLVEVFQCLFVRHLVFTKGKAPLPGLHVQTQIGTIEIQTATHCVADSEKVPVHVGMQHELATEHINHAGSRNVDIPHKPHQSPTPANKKQKLVRLQAGFSARRHNNMSKPIWLIVILKCTKCIPSTTGGGAWNTKVDLCLVVWNGFT